MRSPSTNHVILSRKYARAAAPLVLMALLLSLLLPGAIHAATAPSLGTAASFAVLGGATVTNTGPSVITGDLGVSPGNAITGFPPGLVGGGAIHAADAVALQAQNDVTTAYNFLAGQACNTILTGQDLGGLTLTPGTYCFTSSAQLTGTLTLDAQGDSAAVFIFQIASTLTTASNATVQVINGGLPCGAYWQVGSSATLGTTTTFVGNILALTSITLQTGTSVAGRALARNGAVTLDTNTVSFAACTPPVTTTPVTTTPVTPTVRLQTVVPLPGLPETPTPVTRTATATPQPDDDTPEPERETPDTGVGTATPIAGTTPSVGITPSTGTVTPGTGVGTATPDIGTATPGSGTGNETATPGTRTATPARTPSPAATIPLPKLPSAGSGGGGAVQLGATQVALLTLLIACLGLARRRAAH